MGYWEQIGASYKREPDTRRRRIQNDLVFIGLILAVNALVIGAGLLAARLWPAH